MKLLLAGSASITAYPDLMRKLKSIVKQEDLKNVHFLTCNHNPFDKIVNRCLEKEQYDVQIFEINWEKYGKRAAYARNVTISNKATHAIIFWDGVDEETQSLIELLKQKQVKYRVLKVKGLINENKRENTRTH